MPNKHYTAQLTNGHDLEVEEPSPHYHSKTSEDEKQSEIERITLWDLIKAEWRTVGMILAPFALSIAAYLIPATKSELATVRTEAASNLDLAKADVRGQFQAIDAKINGLQAVFADTKADVKEMRGDLKELLKRTQEPRQVDPQPIIAASPPSAPPPPFVRVDAPKPHKAVTKRTKSPVQASSWSIFSR